MAIYGERTRRTLRLDEKGLTGTKVYFADWTDVDPTLHASLPHIGDGWDGTLAYLICRSISMEEADYNLCELTAEYSTGGAICADFVEQSFRFGGAVEDRTLTWTWEDADTPVTDHIPTPVTVGTYEIRARVLSVGFTEINAASNCVNDRKFRGFPAGTLLFGGLDTDETYTIAGALIDAKTVVRFSYKKDGHNYVWRPALQKRDIDGNLVYYQDIDADQDNYVDPAGASAHLAWTPVYVTGTPGTPALDRPVNPDGDYIYGDCDFATVLNIPTIAGDDAPG